MLKILLKRDNKRQMKSQLIEQRQNQSLPKDFESAGFDNLGGFGLEQFTPR